MLDTTIVLGIITVQEQIDLLTHQVEAQVVTQALLMETALEVTRLLVDHQGQTEVILPTVDLQILAEVEVLQLLVDLHLAQGAVAL